MCGGIVECVQTALGYLLDIIKIYLKFAMITLVIYFAAEWYIVRYDGNFNDPPTSTSPSTSTSTAKSQANSTADKLVRFVFNFLIG